MKAIEKNKPFHSPIRDGKVKQVVSLQVKASQAKYWKQMAEKLGIDDFSSFVRGAVDSAIHSSSRNEDSKWQEFIEAIQPTAKKILGYGFFDVGADLFEASGIESSGVPAKAFLAKMKKKHGAVKG